MRTFASLFSGGGGVDIGAVQAGYTPVWAIEYDPAIAEVYAANIGRHVTCARVEDVDPADYDRPDVLWASPPCPSFSVANSQRGETDADLTIAKAVANFIRVLTPPVFCLENVPAYRHSCSLAIIEAALTECGYWTQASVLNAADYGVPQTRKRLILRACRDGFPPPLPSPTKWIGWYEAIEDLIPTLPPSQFAPWQLRRLEKLDLWQSFLMTPANANQEWGTGTLDAGQQAMTLQVTHGAGQYRAFLVEGVAAGERPPTVCHAEEPAFTIITAGGGRVHRTWLEQGRVVSMTTRALARFQSFPDSYELPAKNALACKVIGNAVPCELARRLLAGMEAAV